MKSTTNVLLAAVGLLLLLGVLVLDSAAVHQATPSRWQAHLGWLGLGIVVAGGLACVPTQAIAGGRGPRRGLPSWLGWVAAVPLPTWLWLLAVLQLVLVLIPGLSEVRNGARRWPVWGGQPSEFAKLALIIALASYLARHEARMDTRGHGFLRPAALAALTAGLVFAEPDWGGAAVILLVAGGLMFLGGTPWFYLLSAGAILSLSGVHVLLENPHRLGRVLAFWDPEAHQHGAGFQQWRSLLALASGGWWGRFFGEGRFQAGYVPEQETDFVFCLVVEELGWAGGTGVILLYGVIIACGLRIAARVADPFSRLLAAGVTLWVGVQALIHLGVTTASLPNKGLPLPFVSYGGSNLVCLLAGIGLLAGVAWRAPLLPQPDPCETKAADFARRVGRLVRRWLGGRPAAVPVRHAYQRPPASAAHPYPPYRSRPGGETRHRPGAARMGLFPGGETPPELAGETPAVRCVVP